ncbi:hypothetical protein K469DRAFT_698574, partial [Zopfia rhizophila CBS 207.26]
MLALLGLHDSHSHDSRYSLHMPTLSWVVLHGSDSNVRHTQHTLYSTDAAAQKGLLISPIRLGTITADICFATNTLIRGLGIAAASELNARAH